MHKLVRIQISGSGEGTDAPTAEDLLDQLRDWLDILRGVEEAVAPDGQPAIDWRIVNASRNSPLRIEFEAFPRHHATNIDRRAEIVLSQVAVGLNAIQSEPARPEYFTDRVLNKARGMFERVTNGLNLTEVDFGEDLPQLRITPSTARSAAKNAEHVLKPVSKPYREFGSVEGFFQGAERDGHGRKIMFIRHRVTGEPIKCVVSGQAAAEVERHQIADVYRNHRVQVFGMLQYRALGKLSQVEATAVKFLRPRSDLPQIEDIVDPDFTGGMRSEDYIEEMRNGRLS